MRWVLVLGISLMACSCGSLELRPSDQARATCHQGNMEDCTAIGLEHYRKKRFGQAAKFLQRACDGGHPRGCCALGGMYWAGKGVAEDMSQAERLQRQACDANNVRCCDNLGLLYVLGKIEGKDGADALPLFKIACDGGHMRGCYNLGVLHSEGKWVKKDQSEAARFYGMACDRNSIPACNNLALLYRFGHGVEKDEFQALAYYRRACARKFKHSCGDVRVLERVTRCRTTCERAEMLMKAGIDSRSGEVSKDQAIKRLIRLHPLCFDRCIEDAVDHECVRRAQSAVDLAPCHTR